MGSQEYAQRPENTTARWQTSQNTPNLSPDESLLYSRPFAVPKIQPSLEDSEQAETFRSKGVSLLEANSAPGPDPGYVPPWVARAQSIEAKGENQTGWTDTIFTKVQRKPEHEPDYVPPWVARAQAIEASGGNPADTIFMKAKREPEHEPDYVPPWVAQARGNPTDTIFMKAKREPDYVPPWMARAQAIDAEKLETADQEELAETEEGVQRSIDATPPEDPDQLVQRSGAGAPQGQMDLESQLGASKGRGSPLPDDVRGFMEPRFGVDFGGVRVHTGGDAVQMNRSVGAKAFAYGSDIYYGAGNGPGNDELTAHELTHTIQQTGGMKLGRKIQQSTLKSAAINDQEPLQTKSLPNLTQHSNRDIRRQLSLEDDQSEPIHAKQIDGFSLTNASAKVAQRSSQEEDQGLLQAKELGDFIPTIRTNRGIQLKSGADNEAIQPKELFNLLPKEISTKSIQLQSEQEQPETIQAKKLSGSPPDQSVNEDVQLQLEQEEEPIQAKEICGLTSTPNREIQLKPVETVNQINSESLAKHRITERTPALQRGILSSIKGLAERGGNWIASRVIEPLKQLAGQGWNSIKSFGSQIQNAYQQANPNIRDLFNPHHLIFRTVKNLRRNLFAKAIQKERQQQTQDATRNPDSNAPVNEPSHLEKLDGFMQTFENGADRFFEINTEIVEGAVLGDFKENPTIWNTIGQIAIGFVPYAGQVADVRDMVAAIDKLRKSGWKDGGAWFDLVLTGVGFIPGFGDAIKAVGRGAKGFLGKALKGVLKNADKLLGPVLKRAKGMLSAAGKYGKRFIGWAKQLGPKLLRGVKQAAQRATDFAKAVGQRARNLVKGLQTRVGQVFRGAMDRAKGLMSRAKGFLGQAVGKFLGKAKQVFGDVQKRLSGAVDSVKQMVQRGKEIALRVGRKIADVTQKARSLMQDFMQSAMKRGQEALAKAKKWGAQQLQKAKDLGSRLIKGARQRVANLIRKGVDLAKKKVIPRIQQKLQGVKERIKNFLKEKWERLKEKFGNKKSKELTSAPPKRTQSELDDLAKDPAHGNKIEPKGIQERQIGLTLEARGDLKPPIKRDPSGAAEFIDGDGVKWDIKGFNSNYPPKKGGFSLNRDLGKIEAELNKGEHVILDTTQLSPTHLQELQVAIQAKGWSGKIRWYP
jgi:hypothetical protein